MSICIPLELHIVRRPFEPPIGQRATALELLFQSLAIRSQFRVAPVLTSDLEAIVNEFVRYVAVIFVDLLSQGFHFEDPAVAGGEGAAELVVMWVVDGIVAVAAIDDAANEVTGTV
jgi:hypothetical protein